MLEKSGHAKDRIGAMYRDLMIQLSNCCSSIKYPVYVLKGLKTKNTRTITSCLLELARLIDLGGIDVIGQKGLKEIVKCCDGKDQNVRNAALDGITACYHCLGGSEPLYDMLDTKTPDKVTYANEG